MAVSISMARARPPRPVPRITAASGTSWVCLRTVLTARSIDSRSLGSGIRLPAGCHRAGGLQARPLRRGFAPGAFGTRRDTRQTVVGPTRYPGEPTLQYCGLLAAAARPTPDPPGWSGLRHASQIQQSLAEVFRR